MFLGWSSRTYPLRAADVAAAPDYDGAPIADADLPDDPVILLIRPDGPDALLRGRAEAEAAGSGAVDVRVAFVPSIAKWNLLPVFVRFLRDKRRYEGSGIYHIATDAIRRMGLERAVRTLENPHRRGGVDRRAKMARLESSLRERGYDDSHPVNVMLCRTLGMEDSLRQGHHRISACLECGIPVMTVHFSAAAALPRGIARFVKRPPPRTDVLLHSMESLFGLRIAKLLRAGSAHGRRDYVAAPADGGRFAASLFPDEASAMRYARLRCGHSAGALSRPVPVCGHFMLTFGALRGMMPLRHFRRDESGGLVRDFRLSELKSALESGYGIQVRSVSALQGRAHSLNFRIVSDDGAVFVAKCIPSAREGSFSRLLAHTASVRCANATRRLFGGKVLDFGAWKVLALVWIGGRRVFPDELAPGELDSLRSAYAEFASGLVDDGAILPVRDALELKRSILARIGDGSAPWLARELKMMDDANLVLAPEAVRIIHGDLHYENFRLAGGGGDGGFLDIEELRFGTPAEDFVRYVVCRAERRKWNEWRVPAKLLGLFREAVEKSGLSRREWLFAIDGYLLRKIEKNLKAGPPGLAAKLNLSMRFRFYRAMREIVYAALPSGRTGGPTVVKIFGGTVRRFIGGDGSFLWKDRILFTCDPACEDYDWLCVYDEIPPNWPGLRRGGMPLRCPKERTILATQEPVAVKSYCAPYVMQFGHLLTNRPECAERHPGRFAGAGYMVWYTGRSFAEERAREPACERAATVTAVCSAKRMRHTAHAARCELMEVLEREVPGFARYGKGVRPLERKCDALDGFMYHVAMENHIAPGHWTEKLADPIVCGCLTFYAGDPEAAKVLPERSFVPIPASDPERAAEIVKKAVADGEWEKRRGAIAEARALLMEKHNLFAQIAALIESAGADAAAAKAPSGPAMLLSRRQARRRHPLAALSDAAAHVARFIKSKKEG